MDIRKLLAENRLIVFLMAACIAAGAAFLIFGKFLPEPGDFISEKLEFPTEIKIPERENFSYELAIEQRLADFFSLVEGAGKVHVMVSPLASRETVFAVDTNSNQSHTTEQDSQGGTRETRNYQNNEKTVIITNRQGADTPLVLREIEPRIEGIVIIAEGGDDPFVREALTRAARAVLGLDAHMIQVLTMAALPQFAE
ncbi:MAG: hypothetical protein FWD19_00800 [Defluviitaleaceae bacterium]|nr:hypothetical protein [Defluviitaleaceae bacterium]